jgi:trk system potassium uptake protein TrkA
MTKFRKNNESSGLNIIVVGCGKVGSTLTERLYKEGHDVTIVDTDPSKLQNLTNNFDVMGIVGNGASYSTQIEAGIENADLIIAVTGSDELNLLCCTVAKRVSHCDAIARVRNPDYSEEVGYLREKLGLSMIINPELEAANEIARILCLPTALGVSPFSRSKSELVKFKIPAGNVLCGQKIRNLGKLAQNVLFCAIERGDSVYIPDGNFEFMEGDSITFIASAKAATTFFEKAGFQTHKVKNTIIIGGGKAAYYLGKLLLSLGIRVKIIESDRQRCNELTTLLPGAVIINGNGTDEDVLKEEGIHQAESFVPLTGIDEENILLTLYAREASNAKVVTKINRITFNNVITNLDLGSVVHPKYITSETIVAYVRAKKNSMNSGIETLYHMFDSRAEAIEFKVNNAPEITDIPLKDLRLKSHLLIANIARDGHDIIPGGDDCIKNGDSVIVVTTHTGFHDIHDILEKPRG